MHIRSWSFQYRGILILQCIYACTSTTTTPGPSGTPLPQTLPLCQVAAPCLNGGTCREPEDWECSTDPGMGDTVCDCPTRFTGPRCEKSTVMNSNCGNDLCIGNEKCVLRDTEFLCVDGNDMQASTAPMCQSGPHPVTYNLKKRDIPAVCLDMYYANTSSLCYDIDSSMSFNFEDQDIQDFFCLEIDYREWQTCLRVNKTFTAANFPGGAVHNVTLNAEENDGHPRSDRITFIVTFNTAPNVTYYTRNFAVNMAAVGRQFTIDVPKEFGVTDSDKLTYTLAETNSPHSIDPNTGSLNITLRDGRDKVINIKIRDDGVPRLGIEVTVYLTVLNFECSKTASQLYVDYDSIGGDAVGKIECVSSGSYTYEVNYNQTQGIDVEINSNNLILVRNGSRGTYILQVTLALPYNISVTVDIKIIIGDLLTCVFRMTNETWTPDLAITSSSVFTRLKTNVETEIINETGSTGVIVNVIRFSPGSVWTYFTLLAQDKANLTTANDILKAAADNGFIGIIPVDSYRFVKGVGYLQADPIVYNNSEAGNTPSSTVNTTRVELRCSWFILLPVGETTVEWKMTERHAPIVPVDNSRFQIDTTRPASEIFISTLTIYPILFKDSGPFTCGLRDQGSLSVLSQLSVRVIAPPVLTLTPIRQAFINTTDSVTLVCNVTEPRNINTNITWYIDGNVNKIETTTTSSLTVLGSSTPNTTYYCQGGNRAGYGFNSTVTTVYILPPEIKQCADDGIWPKTKAEETAEALCPTGETGIRTRKCNETGDWRPEVRSQCVSNNLQSVIDDVEYIAEGVQVSKLSTVAKNLSEATKPDELESKEVDLTIDTLEVLLDTARTTNVTEDKNETLLLAEGFVNTVSNTIDEQAIDKWNYTAQDNSTNSPTQTLNVVDSLTELVSESLSEGQQFTVDSPNIVLQVAKTDPNETKAILFPDDSEDMRDTNVTSSVKLEAETMKALADGQSIRYSIIYYKNLTTVLPGVNEGANDNSNKTVNSGVWGVNIFPTPTKKLAPPIQLNFTSANKTIYDNNPFCGYLDISTNTWMSDGCRYIRGTLNYTLCSCDHLTNFAVLMRPYTPNGPINQALSVITIVGCSISIFCLTLTVIIYITMWKYVKSDQAIILMNICVFLAIAMLLFILGVNRQGKSDAGCKAVAVFLHLFYLLAFFMMLAAGVETLWTILAVFSFRGRSKAIPLLIVGWVLPIIIVVVSAGATQLRGYGNDFYCWLSTDSGLIWAFAGPVLLVVLVNFVIIGKLVHSLLTLRFVRDQHVREKIKKALRGMCVLIPVLGVSWVFGILAVTDELVAFQYIFAILNSLQGLFIFITQCAIKKSVRNGVKNFHRQMRSRRMLNSGLQSSQRRNASRRQQRGAGDSYHNLLQSQSVSEGPAQQATNERIQSVYRVPDSPRYARRVDIDRLGDTQESMLPDEPPPRMLSSEGFSTRRQGGAKQQVITAEPPQRIFSPERSPHLLSRHRPGGTYQRSIPEEPPQRSLSPEQSSHLLAGRRLSDTYQRTISPQGFPSPEQSPNYFSGRRPSDTYQKTLSGEPPQRPHSPKQSSQLSRHRPSGTYERAIPEIPSRRFLSSEQGQRHRPSGTYQRAIPHDAAHGTPSPGIQGQDNMAYQGDGHRGGSNPFASGGHMRSRRMLSSGLQSSQPDDDLRRSPFHPPWSDPSQQTETQRRQYSWNPSNVSSRQPRLDFVPFAVRGDARRLSGSTATSPFLHPDMLGTTSHGDQAMDVPFSAFRQPTSTLKRRGSNA